MKLINRDVTRISSNVTLVFFLKWMTEAIAYNIMTSKDKVEPQLRPRQFSSTNSGPNPKLVPNKQFFVLSFQMFFPNNPKTFLKINVVCVT